MQKGEVTVTKCATAYQELSHNEEVTVETSTITNIVPVNPQLGIGRSIIFFRDGSSMNVMESPEELFALRYSSH